ncbi:MAG TPA: hypothetical protein VKV73_18810 [Chloroflexota bacterium]|nr:hypothetical protein [Chloroflexota bacterium]
MARRPECVLENPVGGGKCRGTPAIGADGHHVLALDVRVRNRGPRPAEIRIVRRVLVEDRAAVGERVLDGKRHRQLVVRDLDQLDGGLGGLACLGGDGRHPVADEPHLVTGEHRPVLEASAEARVLG